MVIVELNRVFLLKLFKDAVKISKTLLNFKVLLVMFEIRFIVLMYLLLVVGGSFRCLVGVSDARCIFLVF